MWSPLAGGWLTGKYRRGMEQPTTGRAARAPERFDLSRPGNQKKLDVIEELDKLAADAGIPLIHLALAFVINHPAVTAAIIGPRTMEQLEGQLGAPDVRLDDAVLDRIDELVAPGTNLNIGDGGYQPPAITSAWRRRRPR